MGDHRGRATPATPPRRRWRPWLAVLVGALALALGVAACRGGDKPSGVASLGGAGSATGTTTANAGEDVDPVQAALAYGRCMRQHGVNIPDPRVDADGGLDMELPPGVNRDAPKFKAADQACGRYLPPREHAPISAQQRQQALAYARCVRQHGINNMPDPQFSGDGIRQQLPTGMSRNDPRLRAAERACRQQGDGGGKR